MKIFLSVLAIVLVSYSSVWSGDFEETKKLAEQDDPSAQHNLGLMYYMGQGVEQDYAQAAYWYTKAAKQDFPYAQNNLGMIYLEGKGVPQNYLLGEYWITKSAENKNSLAQLNLGVMYHEGQGIQRDYKKAVYWFTKAAEQEEAEAQYNLWIMYYKGQGVKKDYQNALYWLSKAAEQGNTKSQYELGVVYIEGIGGPKDYKNALYWFSKAGEKEHPDAMYQIGIMHEDGLGVPQNYELAAYWYEKAAKKGHSEAQFCFGAKYFFGQGVPQNFQLSYVWNSLAASKGSKGGIEFRDHSAEYLSPHQLVEAQRMAAQIQYQINHPSVSQESQHLTTKTEKTISGSGTGFLITTDGFIMTCHHVIENSEEIKVVVNGTTFPAKIIRDDPYNDLSLLKINGSFSAIAFSSDHFAKIGQEVFTIGYPNPSIQGVSAKFTKGTISSLTGFQDDVRLYQISVPVQPGNSGGALLGENGDIVGIVVAMLDAHAVFEISGSIPQNVNYAIKGIYAQTIIETVPGLADKLVASTNEKANAVKRAMQSTVMILCYSN